MNKRLLESDKSVRSERRKLHKAKLKALENDAVNSDDLDVARALKILKKSGLKIVTLEKE